MARLPVPVHVLEAADGQNPNDSEFSRYSTEPLFGPEYPFEMKSGEIGCFISHRAAWSEIIARGWDAGLILEDDVSIDPKPFQRAFDLALNHVGPMTYTRFPWRQKEAVEACFAEEDDIKLFCPSHVGLGTQAQIVGRGAAERLLALTEQFDRPVDTFLQMTWKTGVEMRVIWPSGVSEISYALGGTTLTKAKRGLNEKIKAELLRTKYRRQIASLSRAGGG
jgi:GR25 family glycosyltransferase involved in LPS biosynthesis